MLTKAVKNEIIKELEQDFKESKHIVFINYKGMNFEQLNNLRNKLKEMDSRLKVVKNSLAKIASKNLNLGFNDEWFKEQVALIFIKSEDFIKPLKVLYDFRKEVENLKIVLGVINKKDVYRDATLKELSLLPSREEILARLVNAINSPINLLVIDLKYLLRKLVLTLKAIESKKS